MRTEKIHKMLIFTPHILSKLYPSLFYHWHLPHFLIISSPALLQLPIFTKDFLQWSLPFHCQCPVPIAYTYPDVLSYTYFSHRNPWDKHHHILSSVMNFKWTLMRKRLMNKRLLFHSLTTNKRKSTKSTKLKGTKEKIWGLIKVLMQIWTVTHFYEMIPDVVWTNTSLMFLENWQTCLFWYSFNCI